MQSLRIQDQKHKVLFLHTQNDRVNTEVEISFKVTQKQNKETLRLISNKTYAGLVPECDKTLMEDIRNSGEGKAPTVPGIENSSDLFKLILGLTYFLSSRHFMVINKIIIKCIWKWKGTRKAICKKLKRNRNQSITLKDITLEQFQAYSGWRDKFKISETEQKKNGDMYNTNMSNDFF